MRIVVASMFAMLKVALCITPILRLLDFIKLFMIDNNVFNRAVRALTL